MYVIFKALRGTADGLSRAFRGHEWSSPSAQGARAVNAIELARSSPIK